MDLDKNTPIARPAEMAPTDEENREWRGETVTMTIDTILAQFHQVKKCNQGWSAQCPSHNDSQNSLSIAEGDDSRVLLKRFAGCTVDQIVQAVGLTLSDLFPDRGKTGQDSPRERSNCATVEGCTLAEYSAAKQLPLEFLHSLGLSDYRYQKRPAVRLPYRNEQGEEVAVRYRLALNKSEHGDQRFRWKQGAKPCLYGLWRLESIRAAGSCGAGGGRVGCTDLVASWH